MAEFDKGKIHSIQNKLNYITPNMIVLAITNYVNCSPDAYRTVYDIVDTFTYNHPEIIVDDNDFFFKIIDDGYKDAMDIAWDGHFKEKELIELALEQANEIFKNNMITVMADILEMDNFKKHTKLFVDKSLTVYLRTIQNLPQYEIIHFNENQRLKNFIMLTFLTCLLYNLESEESYTIVALPKTSADVITSEMYQIIGGVKNVSMYEILFNFVKTYVTDKPIVAINGVNQYCIEWIDPSYVNFLKSMFSEPIQFLINKRLMAMENNIKYMCEMCYIETYGKQQNRLIMEKNLLENTIEAVIGKLKQSPLNMSFHFADSVVKNIAMSYIF